MSRTVYRPPIALAVRGVGYGAAALGVAVVGVSLATAFDLPGWLRTTLVAVFAVVAMVALVVLVVGVVRALGWGTRLVLDDSGFVNATGPGAGVRRAPWKDVRKVQADGPVVSVDLAGDRQSLIRTSSLDVDPRVLARELRARLNQDRGYTPLN